MPEQWLDLRFYAELSFVETAETLGISGALISNVRPLSLEDAEALARLPQVVAAVPVVQGNARAEQSADERRNRHAGRSGLRRREPTGRRTTS